MSDLIDICAADKNPLYNFPEADEKIKTKIIFSGFKEGLTRLSPEIKGKKALLFCAENAFTKIGKPILSELENSGALSPDIIALDDECLSEEAFFALSGNFDVLVAAGDGELMKIAKSAAQKRGAKCILIPTDCRQSELLSTKDGDKPLATPFAAIIDRVLYTTPKKQLCAEAYGDILAASLALIDYKIAVLTGKSTYSPTFYEIARESVSIAVNIRHFLYPQEMLMIAELKLSVAKEYSSALNFSSAETTAKYLGKISDAPLGERKYRAFSVLLPLYKLYMSSDYPLNFVFPDGLKALGETSRFFGIEEHDLVNLFSIPTPEEREKNIRIKNLVKDNIIKELDGIGAKLGTIGENYRFLYDGRHRLSEFSTEELKKAVKAAAYESNGNLLAIMKAEGFAEFI